MGSAKEETPASVSYFLQETVSMNLKRYCFFSLINVNCFDGSNSDVKKTIILKRFADEKREVLLNQDPSGRSYNLGQVCLPSLES